MEQQEPSVLFTDAGLHPGSPRFAPQQQAQPHQHQSSGVAGDGDARPLQHPPAPRPSKPDDDGGSFVYRQTGSFEASEELDAE